MDRADKSFASIWVFGMGIFLILMGAGFLMYEVMPTWLYEIMLWVGVIVVGLVTIGIGYYFLWVWE